MVLEEFVSTISTILNVDIFQSMCMLIYGYVNKIFVFTLGILWVSTRTDVQTARSRGNSEVNPFTEILVIFLFVYNQIPGNPVSFFFVFTCQSIFKHPLDVTRYLLLLWLTMTSWAVNSVTLSNFVAETSFFSPFFFFIPPTLAHRSIRANKARGRDH